MTMGKEVAQKGSFSRMSKELDRILICGGEMVKIGGIPYILESDTVLLGVATNLTLTGDSGSLLGVLPVPQQNSSVVDDANPGIRPMLKFLHRHGFDTVDSGDGVTHEFGCDRPFPYVVIKCRPGVLASETRRVMGLLVGHGVEFGAFPPGMDVLFDEGGVVPLGLPSGKPGTTIESCYLPLQDLDYGYIDISFMPGDEQKCRCDCVAIHE